jgi:hypothetical protein
MDNGAGTFDLLLVSKFAYKGVILLYRYAEGAVPPPPPPKEATTGADPTVPAAFSEQQREL